MSRGIVRERMSHRNGVVSREVTVSAVFWSKFRPILGVFAVFLYAYGHIVSSAVGLPRVFAAARNRFLRDHVACVYHLVCTDNCLDFGSILGWHAIVSVRYLVCILACYIG